jgi:hypothetical protein
MSEQTIEETIALLIKNLEVQGKTLRDLFEIQKELSDRIKLLEDKVKE